ncbi:hypothetical protein TREES_T100021489 [Tupaia chinensis]|uniref:Uncharacterized protein n=1 Tax=Tupaia chinensis TaxID=246437 RepID=L9KMG7_TUPCH|nr:hypothetical protein TREES_T100021489 [Tupaia chinensis]
MVSRGERNHLSPTLFKLSAEEAPTGAPLLSLSLHRDAKFACDAGHMPSADADEEAERTRKHTSLLSSVALSLRVIAYSVLSVGGAAQPGSELMKHQHHSALDGRLPNNDGAAALAALSRGASRCRLLLSLDPRLSEGLRKPFRYFL